MLDSMLESITSDIEYVGVDVPDLRMLESVVNNLRVLQDQLSLDQQQGRPDFMSTGHFSKIGTLMLSVKTIGIYKFYFSFPVFQRL